MEKKKKNKGSFTSENIKPPNRKERRKQIQENNRTIPPKYRAIGKQIGFLISVLFGIITVFGFLFSVYPRISVYPGETLDPFAPFQTPLIIKNDGYLPLRYIHYTVTLDSIVFEKNVQLSDITVSFRNTIPLLGANKLSTVSLKPVLPLLDRSTGGLSLSSRPIKSAKIGVVLSYQSFYIPYVFTDRIPFKMETKASGEHIWFPTHDKN